MKDWDEHRRMSAALLERATGEGVDHWVARMRAEAPADRDGLRRWLEARGVSGYARQLLMWERLGYPDYMTTAGEALIDAQYADRPALRPVYDAVIATALALEGVEVQARKTYVCLVTPRRTFARLQTGPGRLNVALRLDAPTEGRLHRSRIHETMPVELRLERVEDLDAGALAILDQAYRQNL
jgi:hypothetical protein